MKSIWTKLAAGLLLGVLFAAEWPRNFSVPVHDVTFRYVLPPGVRPDSVTTSPEGGRVENGPAYPFLPARFAAGKVHPLLKCADGSV